MFSRFFISFTFSFHFHCKDKFLKNCMVYMRIENRRPRTNHMSIETSTFGRVKTNPNQRWSSQLLINKQLVYSMQWCTFFKSSIFYDIKLMFSVKWIVIEYARIHNFKNVSKRGLVNMILLSSGGWGWVGADAYIRYFYK